SFFDHFDSFDSSKWANVTSGSGAASNTDSYEQLDAPASSAAFMYYKTQLDITKSQLWTACVSVPVSGDSGFAMPLMAIVNGASAPAADTHSNSVAKVLSSINSSIDNSNQITAIRYDSGGTATYWDGSVPQWTTTYPGSNFYVVNTQRLDNFMQIGLE